MDKQKTPTQKQNEKNPGMKMQDQKKSQDQKGMGKDMNKDMGKGKIQKDSSKTH